MSDSNNYTLKLETKANKADKQAVEDGLLAYNLRFVPDPDFKELNIFIRDKAGNIAGGLLGATYWGWLYVSILWVGDHVQGRGFGSQLMTMAETEARKRGCRHVHLDTLDFQALPFYEKLGYTIFGELDDLPPGHKRYFLQKSLGVTDA